MGNILEELDPLFNPVSVAVIGASNNWNKWGNSTFACVLSGFKGRVYPINNKEDEVLSHRAYKSVLDVPDHIDLAIFVIPAEKIPPIMEECVEKGVKASIIISAGFRETGEDGRRLEDEVIRIAGKGGIRFVGPNCMGLWSASSDLRAYMFPLPSRDGPVAFVTQGGNVGGAISLAAYERGIGLHRYVSCGPAADIQIEDYIEYFGEEDSVKVIMTYIEGLNDGKRFIEKVSKVTRKKPVVVYKPGRTEAGAKAILSHSGSLAGSDEIYEKAFKKAGVIRAESPEELLDLSIGFLTQPLPEGRNVAIITGGGSYGVICAEYCASLGLNVVNLPETTISDLNKIFPPRWSHGNPIDPAGDRNFIAYYIAPAMILKLREVDSLIFMGFGSLSGFSNVLTSGGFQIFGRPLSSSFSSFSGLNEILESVTSAIRSGDPSQFKQIIEPFKPFFASTLGSDPKTTDSFIDFVISGDIIREALVEVLSSIPEFIETISKSESVEAGINGIFERLDILISAFLLQYAKSYKKPVISTTFSEMQQAVKGGLYPYSTAGKAAKTMSKLVEYKEYLERVGAYGDPFEFCTLLNQELV